MTLGELIRDTEKRFRAAKLFYGHGTSHPGDEAAWLVRRALRLPFDAPLEKTVGAKGVKKIAPLVRKRVEERIPVAYLLNEAWLDDHAFYVDRRVIIPRSHIAAMLKGKLFDKEPARILDLCTGSGCLAILAALRFLRARVVATDLSPAALEVARENIARYKLGKRIRLLESDLFEKVEGRYDLVLANPPYVSRRAMRTLPREYRYEPGLALAGGADGLALIRRLIAESGSHLAWNGLLLCEVGDGRRALERTHRGARLQWPLDEVFSLRKGVG